MNRAYISDSVVDGSGKPIVGALVTLLRASGDIARALDRANDKYSSVAPYLKQELMFTIPGSRIYPSPEGCWWIDSVEYPYGQWPKWYQTFQKVLSPYIPEPPEAAPGLARWREAR